MDTINLQQLRLSAHIGTKVWERALPQTLLIDVSLGTDITSAAKDDELSRTIDYVALVEGFRDFVSGTRYHLLETFAEKSAAFLLKTYGLPWVRFTVQKLAVMPDVKAISVTIERYAQ